MGRGRELIPKADIWPNSEGCDGTMWPSHVWPFPRLLRRHPSGDWFSQRSLAMWTESWQFIIRGTDKMIRNLGDYCMSG